MSRLDEIREKLKSSGIKEEETYSRLDEARERVANYNKTLEEVNRLKNAANYPRYEDQIVALQNKAKETNSSGGGGGHSFDTEANFLKVPEYMKDNNRRFEDGYQFGDVIKTLGEKKCSYCGTVVLEIFDKVFLCNNIVQY